MSGLVIDTMYAWVAEDDLGEGVMAVQDPDGNWVPMIGADMDRMDSLRPFAEKQTNDTGKPAKLIRFDHRTVVEIYEQGVAEETQP